MKVFPFLNEESDETVSLDGNHLSRLCVTPVSVLHLFESKCSHCIPRSTSV